MNDQLIEQLKKWFYAYVTSFHSKNEEVQQNFTLKKEHSLRVCREILNIGEKLGLSPCELNLAEAMALFHDIGRFEQYLNYSTFRDLQSANHAELGVKVLRENNVLIQLDSATQDLIYNAISYHNRASLPATENDTCLFYSRLLRDADKLDIWRIVIDYYQRNDVRKNGAIGLGLPDTPGISDAVYMDLKGKRIVDIRFVKNLNDFKLLQLGWIYDINYKPTITSIQERKYLEAIHAALPVMDKIEEVFNIARSFLNNKLPLKINT